MSRYLPQKVIITNQGQLMQQEVLQQTKQDDYEQKQNKKRAFREKQEYEERLFSQLDVSQQLQQQQNNNQQIQQLQQINPQQQQPVQRSTSQMALQALNSPSQQEKQQDLMKKLQATSPAEMLNSYNYQVIRKANSVKDIQKFLLPQSQNNKISPYLKSKLNYAVGDILNNNNTNTNASQGALGQTNAFNKSNRYDQTNNNFFQTRGGNNNLDFSLAQSNIFNSTMRNGNKQQSMDELMQERSNKMIFYESKFSKMYENHIKNQKNKLEDLKKSSNNLHTLIEKNSEQNHLTTRPETLQEINGRYSEAMDIIGYQNNTRKREKELLHGLHLKQYGQKWNSSYFPMTKDERKELGLPLVTYKPRLKAIKRVYNVKGKKEGWVY